MVTSDTSIQSSSVAITHPSQQISSVCFLHLDGNKLQDSTTVQLVIKGNAVSGEMNWLPSQKDGRKGLLTGAKSGDIIHAMWTFKQEGMTDSMSVDFRLAGDSLVQKPFKADPKTGRQETDESAAYSVMYKPLKRIKR